MRSGWALLEVRLGGGGCGRSCCATEGDWALVMVLLPALSEGWASTEAAGAADVPMEVWSAFTLLFAALLLRRRAASIRVSR